MAAEEAFSVPAQISQVCDVTLIERPRPLPPDIHQDMRFWMERFLLKTMRTIEDKNIPLEEN